MTVVCELVTDGRGLITSASPEAAALLAIEGRWLVHKPLAGFVAAPDRQRFRTFLLELETGRSAGGRARFVLESRSGAEIPAVLAAQPRNGAVAWRVVAETEIEPVAAPAPSMPAPDPERLFERLLTCLPHGILVIDPELRLVYVNPAARRLLGGNVGGRPGEPLPDCWPDFSLRDLAASLFTRSPGAGPHLVDAGGRVICVEGLSAAHTPTATLLLDDVTERERARRSERRFIENAAHELRTPLAAIVSVIDALESGAKEVPETRDRFLAHIREQSARLSRLATSLLVLARIQTGQERPRLDLVPVEPLLKELASGLAPPPKVTVEVSAPKDVAVLADRDLLCQALENITANAIKHTREGKIVLEARDLGRSVEIVITDTGRGMKPDLVQLAFDRFHRAAAPEDEGFGLGLSIADEAVRALGGRIELDSVPKVGTRARITLPSAKLVG